MDIESVRERHRQFRPSTFSAIRELIEAQPEVWVDGGQVRNREHLRSAMSALIDVWRAVPELTSPRPTTVGALNGDHLGMFVTVDDFQGVLSEVRHRRLLDAQGQHVTVMLDAPGEAGYLDFLSTKPCRVETLDELAERI